MINLLSCISYPFLPKSPTQISDLESIRDWDSEQCHPFNPVGMRYSRAWDQTERRGIVNHFLQTAQILALYSWSYFCGSFWQFELFTFKMEVMFSPHVWPLRPYFWVLLHWGWGKRLMNWALFCHLSLATVIKNLFSSCNICYNCSVNTACMTVAWLLLFQTQVKSHPCVKLCWR